MYWGAIIERPEPLYATDKPGEPHIEKTHIEKPGALYIEKPGKVGKFDSLKKEKYLEHIRNGQNRGYSATLVGVHRDTVLNHIKKDPGFAKAVSEAESDAIGKVENALFEAANSGNTTAIQVYLYNRDPRRWADRRNIQLAGAGGGPIEVRDVGAKGKILSMLARLVQSKEKDKESDPASNEPAA